MSAAGAPLAALLGFGQVRHTRTRPRAHAFAYATYFLMLPMRALQKHGPGALARNRFAALSFYDCDHGEGGPDALAWIDGLLTQHGIHSADGEIWLHTYPRIWGYTFKPVSFWHCHRSDGSLAAIVAEVNNTFGERHCYLLPEPRYGHIISASKQLHVSPFCPVRGHYRFVFMRSDRAEGPRLVARIDYHDEADAEAIICTSISGALVPLNAATVRQASWSHPLMTWGVMARIHWQALRLWIRRTPFFRQPPAPTHRVTAGDSSAHRSTPP